MTTNDPRDETILALAGAIRKINANRDAIELANRAEAIVRSAQCAQKLAAQLEEAVVEEARQASIESAHQWMKKHMPASVSIFGGSDGVFGWTGTDAAGNRVSWKVEPPAADVVDVAASPAERLEQTVAAFVKAAPGITASADHRFAADPFAPTFEVLPGVDSVGIKMYPRSGSVQYLINVTGPSSSAVKFEGGVPTPVQVSMVTEAPIGDAPPPGMGPGCWQRVIGARHPVWIEHAASPHQERRPSSGP